MIDIVKRLRNGLDGLGHLCDDSLEAADEIERLRRACTSMRDDCARAGNAVVAGDIEIERLLGALAGAQEMNQRLAPRAFLPSAREFIIATEREACAEACESVHVRPIQGAHEEYLAGKEMAIQQCARAIRRRCTDAP